MDFEQWFRTEFGSEVTGEDGLKQMLSEAWHAGLSARPEERAPEPTMKEARAFVAAWLWQEKYTGRRSSGMAWQYEHTEDAAAMCVVFVKERSTSSPQGAIPTCPGTGFACNEECLAVEMCKKGNRAR